MTGSASRVQSLDQVEASFEQAQYEGNPRFGVEQHGFDYIPESERKMSVTELFFFWVGTNAYIFYIFVGAIVATLGLAFWQSLLAVIVAAVVSFAYVAWGSIAGARSGLPTMTITRTSFGFHGNRAQCLIGWAVSVAFEVLNTVLGVFAVLALFGKLGWDDPGALGKILAVILVFGLAAFVAILGHATVTIFQRVSCFLLVTTLLVVFAYAVGDVDWAAGQPEPLGTSATLGLMLLAGGIIAGGQLSYLYLPADYSRYLPSTTPSGRIFWGVFLGAGGTALFLCILGVMTGSLNADLAVDPVAGMESLIPAWLYIIFIVAAIGGAVTNTVMTVYSSGLQLQAAGLPVRRWQATTVDTVVATVLILYVLLANEDFTTVLNDVISFLVVWVGPLAGVWIVDGALRRWRYDPAQIHAGEGGRYYGWHGINQKGFLAFAAGAVASFLTMNAPAYQGPLSKSILSDGDAAWVLGFPVSALVYLALEAPAFRRPTVPPQGTASAPR